jgi:lipopolysaccharide cholinephosphotransferase
MSYSESELEKLHKVLYEILGEIVRVCDILNIPYFIQGGTAIGAFFENAILPWDDDIDVGMTRENYERFL